jgi:hypothetical protein
LICKLIRLFWATTVFLLFFALITSAVLHGLSTCVDYNISKTGGEFFSYNLLGFRMFGFLFLSWRFADLFVVRVWFRQIVTEKHFFVTIPLDMTTQAGTREFSILF